MTREQFIATLIKLGWKCQSARAHCVQYVKGEVWCEVWDNGDAAIGSGNRRVSLGTYQQIAERLPKEEMSETFGHGRASA